MRGFRPYPAEVIASLHEDRLIYHFLTTFTAICVIPPMHLLKEYLVDFGTKFSSHERSSTAFARN